MMTGQVWSVEECHLLRELYPQGAQVCAQALPGRSLTSIWFRARKIGISTVKPPSWSHDEDATLREFFPQYNLLLERLPGRSRIAIKGRAAKLKLQKTHTLWTGAEVATVRRYAETMTRKEIVAKHAHRAPKNIDRVMSAHGIRAKRLPPGMTGKPLLDTARQRCFDLGLSFKEVGRLAGSASVLTASHHAATTGVQSGLFAEAVRLLGGEFYAEWDD